MDFFNIPKGWLFQSDNEVVNRYWAEYQWRYWDSHCGELVPIIPLPTNAQLLAHVGQLRREHGVRPRVAVGSNKATMRPGQDRPRAQYLPFDPQSPNGPWDFDH